MTVGNFVWGLLRIIFARIFALIFPQPRIILEIRSDNNLVQEKVSKSMYLLFAKMHCC